MVNFSAGRDVFSLPRSQIFPLFFTRFLHFGPFWPRPFSPLPGLTAGIFCAIFSMLQAVTKTQAFCRKLREGATWWKAPATPQIAHHFRAVWRKCHAGCARYSVNEWQHTLQPGWNRGIQHTMYPTPDLCQGEGFFILTPSEKRNGGNYYVRRKSVHL